MYKLRYYQEDSIDATFDYFSNGGKGNPINALPTGTGKSLIIAGFIERALKTYPNTRVMMLTHVKELIANNAETLTKLWPTAPVGIYSAGLRRRDTNSQIIYGGIGSVGKRANEFGHRDLVLIDECHLVSPASSTMYRKFIEDLTKINPNLKVIGYTATPYRLGVGCLTDGGLFTDICYDITDIDGFERLIAEGYLSPLVPKRTKNQLDVSGVKVQGGEFIQRQLQDAVDKDSVTRKALTELIEQGMDRKHWLIFATGIKHAENITRMLEEMGVPAVSVHSKMTDAERDQAIVDFKSGKVRAAVNNNVLTTGFDFPAIDLIGMLRPTSSPSLWVQMLGRGTRPSTETGKTNCKVLDFAGNTERLGPINDPVIPTKKKGKGGGIAPVRTCPDCDTMVHISVRACPECGYVFPVQEKLDERASEGALLVGALPVVEDFDVRSVSYDKYYPRNGNPPLLLVEYNCGLRTFSDWVCLEHGGNSTRSAQRWWLERSLTNQPIPLTVDNALEMAGQLEKPVRIKVWLKKKLPKVINYEWETLTSAQKPEIPF